MTKLSTIPAHDNSSLADRMFGSRVDPESIGRWLGQSARLRAQVDVVDRPARHAAREPAALLRTAAAGSPVRALPSCLLAASGVQPRSLRGVLAAQSQGRPGPCWAKNGTGRTRDRLCGITWSVQAGSSEPVTVSHTTIDCVVLRVAAKRLHQHPVQMQFAGLPERVNPDRHLLVPETRLRQVSSEQAVPPG